MQGEDLVFGLGREGESCLNMALALIFLHITTNRDWGKFSTILLVWVFILFYVYEVENFLNSNLYLFLKQENEKTRKCSSEEKEGLLLTSAHINPNFNYRTNAEIEM